ESRQGNHTSSASSSARNSAVEARMAVFLAAGRPRFSCLIYLILEPRRSRNGATASAVLSVLPSSTSRIRQSSNVCETTLSRENGRNLAALNAGIIMSTVAILHISPLCKEMLSKLLRDHY